MVRLTELELRREAPVVLANVLKGEMVAVARDDVHLIILTRTSTMADRVIQWADYVGDETYARNVYSLVADRNERIAAVHGSDVVYFLPIGVLGPTNATEQREIEEWLDAFADDWVVGPTFVSVTYETEIDGRRILGLRL